MDINDRENRSALTKHLLPTGHKEESNRAEAIMDGNFATAEEFSPLATPSTLTAVGAYGTGERQPSHWRDVSFTVFFLLQFLAVSVIAFVLGIPSIRRNSSSFSMTKWSIIYMIITAGLSSSILSALALSAMSRMGGLLIKISLWLSICTSLLLTIASYFLNNILGSISGILCAAYGVFYFVRVRHRIPFAAVNLNVGLSAVQCNGSILFVGHVSNFLMFLWVLLWSLSLAGLMDVTSTTSDNEDNAGALSGACVLMLLISLYWTQQVFKNAVRATVAGTVGTWWFDPANAGLFCSSAVKDSLIRSWTYSLGSICFGSLIVAFVRALRTIVEMARNDQRQGGRDRCDNSFLLCIVDCLLSLIGGLMDYVNKWAFIYVGIYGYKYLEAGKRVMNIFHQRGWTLIINENLVGNALGLVAVIIGLLTGVIGIIVDNLWFSCFAGSGNASSSFAFLLSFTIGTSLAFITMGVIESAVDTVTVCFAEAPQVLDIQHPQHSIIMRNAWANVE